MRMKLLLHRQCVFFNGELLLLLQKCHYVGRAYGRSITIYDRFTKDPMPECPEVKGCIERIKT